MCSMWVNIYYKMQCWYLVEKDQIYLLVLFNVHVIVHSLTSLRVMQKLFVKHTVKKLLALEILKILICVFIVEGEFSIFTVFVCIYLYKSIKSLPCEINTPI